MRLMKAIFRKEIVAAIWIRAFGGWWAQRAAGRLKRLSRKGREGRK
jgi:hypothetical protein